MEDMEQEILGTYLPTGTNVSRVRNANNTSNNNNSSLFGNSS